MCLSIGFLMLVTAFVMKDEGGELGLIPLLGSLEHPACRTLFVRGWRAFVVLTGQKKLGN